MTQVLFQFFSSAETWRLVFDKVLLAAVGLLFAMSLERFRRRQSVVGELSKMQAKAFVEVMSAIVESEVRFHRWEQSLRDPEANDVQRAHLREQLDASADALNATGTRNFFLMGTEMNQVAQHYAQLLLAAMREVRTAGQLTARTAVALATVRTTLQSLLPTIQLTDEHSLYLPAPWWSPRAFKTFARRWRGRSQETR